MIRLAQHIEILLLGNECVQVPNLGGFVAHRVEARYDEQEQLFLPPLRTLGFNSHLKMNDSLLAQSYMEAYDLSYPEAMDAIEDEVMELLRIMGNSGSYELNSLGRLYYDKEGRMNFEPCESGILTPEFYALSSFEMPMTTHKVEAVPAEDAAVEAAPVDDGKKRPRIVYIGDERGHKTLNISLKAIRNISVAAVVAATVFLVSFPASNNFLALGTGNVESGFYEMFMPKSEHQQSKTIMPVARTKAPAAPKTAAVVSNDKTKQAMDAAAADDGSDAEQAGNKAAAPGWSIVICSHVPKANAEALTEKLHENGLSDAYMSTEGATKVLYGHYATKEEARKKLNALSNNDVFKDSWILEVKQ